MRFKNLFVKTSKLPPKDAVLKSHQYLIRACYIHQGASGIYSFLPLGQIMLDKIKAITIDELNKASCLHLSMGFLTPAKLWEKSKRLGSYGDELGVYKDRKGTSLVLGPTHEECITDIVSSFVKSYKQLPINLYQINIKFRDELRPRFGLLRGREFIMKDAYSFHANKSCLDSEFLKMQETYSRIFTRLGLDFRIVQADSGAIGGSGSKEFMMLVQSGEDIIITCNSCEYASNIEAAKRKSVESKSIAPNFSQRYCEFFTPSINTIPKLAEFFKIDSYYLIKALVFKVILKEQKEDIAIFFLRGASKIESTKALNALKKLDADVLELIEVDSKELESLGITPGFIGPISIKDVVNTKFIIFDEELRDGQDLICGANKKDYHIVGVYLDEFSDLVYDDLVLVEEGDICPKCNGILQYNDGIEIGHIFKLGTKYSESLEASFLDEFGKSKYFEMGCYGIGISRLLGAILEQKADDKGCIWGDLAPFKVDIIISKTKEQSQVEYANKIYEWLLEEGISVVIDDRDESFGVKISDFELIGFGYALIVGKELQNNKVELIKRQDLSKQTIDCNNIKEILKTI